ncbi:hypothetical protein D9M68_819680 [compost metagenome]
MVVTLALGLVSPGLGAPQLIGRVGGRGSKLYRITATIIVVVMSSKDFLPIDRPLVGSAWREMLAEMSR